MAQLWGQDVCHKVCIEEDALQPGAEVVEVPRPTGEGKGKEVTRGTNPFHTVACCTCVTDTDPTPPLPPLPRGRGGGARGRGVQEQGGHDWQGRRGGGGSKFVNTIDCDDNIG